MIKKINQVVAKADLASALRSNLLNRKKQIRARRDQLPHVDIVSTEIVSDDCIEINTIVKNDEVKE